MTKILIVEDDKIQADELQKRLDQMGLFAETISTEVEFRRKLKTLGPRAYALAVVDMMLRWTDPSPSMELPPAEIVKEGFYTAGLRCCRELREKEVPMIIFTALDPVKIPLRPGENFEIINKSAGYNVLIEKIRQHLHL